MGQKGTRNKHVLDVWTVSWSLFKLHNKVLHYKRNAKNKLGGNNLDQLGKRVPNTTRGKHFLKTWVKVNFNHNENSELYQALMLCSYLPKLLRVSPLQLYSAAFYKAFYYYFQSFMKSNFQNCIKTLIHLLKFFVQKIWRPYFLKFQLLKAFLFLLTEKNKIGNKDTLWQ